MTAPNTIEKFWMSATEAADSGCFVWSGAVSPDGYGIFTYKGRRHLAHRFSYCVSVGEIPDGMVIDHLCHRRDCINPNHLRIATRSENNRNKLMKANKKPGLKGVQKGHRSQRWQARIRCSGKEYSLGTFDSAEQAHAAYVAAAEKLHGDFANDGFALIRNLAGFGANENAQERPRA